MKIFWRFLLSAFVIASISIAPIVPSITIDGNANYSHTVISTTSAIKAADAYTHGNIQPAIILLVRGDSLSVGRVARDNAIDLNWPNVWQYFHEHRNPFPSISGNLQPLDTGEAIGGTLYVATAEYISKQIVGNGAANVYICDYGVGGSRYAAGQWGVGQTYSNSFITVANACIAYIRANVTSSYVIKYLEYEMSNDALSGADPTTFQAAKLADINNVRASIFKNGVSGADTSDSDYLLNSAVPETISSPNSGLIMQANMNIAATITGGKYYRIPEGLHSGDNLHIGLPATRGIISLPTANLYSDTTPPTITGYAASGAYSLLAGQKLALELTVGGTPYFNGTGGITAASGEYAYWKLSGTDAASFEIAEIADGSSGFGPSRVRFYLRIASDGNAVAGTYNLTLTALDGAGNAASTPFVVTVSPAYGTTVAAFNPTNRLNFSATPTLIDIQGRAHIPVTFGAGMNQIHLVINTGGTVPTTLSFNGAIATADPKNPASGNGPYLYYLPMAINTTGDLIIGVSAITSWGSATVEVVSFQGTQATRTDSQTLPHGNNLSPHQPSSAPTYPAGGLVVGAGAVPGTPVPIAGVTALFNSGGLVTGWRNTTGNIGFTGSNGFSNMSAVSWAPAP